MKIRFDEVKMKNKIGILLNILFISGLVLAAYTLIKVYYLDKNNLLPGLCPVNNNRTLIFICIGVLFLYYILSVIYDKKVKND